MLQDNITPQSELQNFIRSCRQAGVNDLVIRDNLLHVGWRKDIVDRALVNGVAIPVPQEKEKGSRSMWDAFEHVLLFISLYTLVISVGSILYILIDRYLPALGTSSYYYQNASSQLSSPVAAVVVSFPLFLFFFTRIAKRTSLNTTIRSLPLRKQLIYLTLVIAFITALIDVTALIYNILTGDLTVNSLLKMLVVLVLAGAVAGYYLIQIKEDAATRD